MKHLAGVGAMIRARGAKNLNSKISRRTFQEYRATMLTIDLASRRASWLSDPEWVNPHWKANDPNSDDILQQVVDIAFHLPPILEKFDRTKATIDADPSESENMENYSILWNIIRKALGVETMMTEYEDRLLNAEPGKRLFIPRPSTSKTDQGKIYPVTYTFPNYDVASSMAYAEMIKMTVYNFLLEVTSFANSIYKDAPRLQDSLFSGIDVKTYSQKAIISADRICMSLDYFLEENKKYITRMVVLAPFQGAMGIFKRHLEEGTGNAYFDQQLQDKVRFCEMVLGRSKQLGLPIWATGQA